MDNENILNVINRSFWTYFNSEKISTIVYDVEIPETLYKELLPHSFDNRNINENEVACIEYRKSMLSSDQDQFLISKFERTNFTLHQQKEIQINDELKKQIRNVCDVYEKKQSYTDAILEKFEAAGIEVVTDKFQFDDILESENKIQKMTNEVINTLEEPVNSENHIYFKFNEEDVRIYNEQIVEWEKDNSNPDKLIIVGHIPPVMKLLNINDNLIEVKQGTLNKIIRDTPVYPTDSQGHHLSKEIILSIPKELADPVMIFKSRTRDDSFVFFTEQKDEDNRTILIPLAVNKHLGRIVINEITSMYGRNNEIEFVKYNIDEDKLVYMDKERTNKWLEQLCENKKSLGGDRAFLVQFLEQRVTDIETYNPSLLTKEKLVKFISSGIVKNVQKMISIDKTYGFVHDGKIYLNPEIMNSNAAVHEYTHLWDAYTQKTNPELWNKGLELFKESNYWNEVISDQNYQNIKDNENLVLSEIHSRISGKFAEQVFNRIAELDGEQVKLDAIDWNKETWLYIQNNFYDIERNEQEIIAEFLSTPIKDLVNEKNINLNIENAQTNTNDLFKDFQFDFSKPVTWHYVDNTSLIYADTFISNEQALSLFNAAGANDSYNEDMQYCIQYRCTSTDKNNLVYLCKFDPNVEITTPLKEIKLPENIINKVMSGVEAGIKEHLQQQHTIPDYLLDAVSYGDKRVVQEEVSDYSTDSNKPEGIMYLSENHNVFYAEPNLPREEYLKLSAQTDIDELKKQQSFLYTDENDDFGYQSNILEQREEFQHKIDRLQAKIDSLNGVPNPLNEIISSQLPASMTSLHSFTEEERMGQFIGMKNDFKNYATEEEIKLLDDKFKTLFVEPEGSVEIKKGEEFHLLADEFESYFQDTKNKHYNVASNQYESYADVAVESDKRSVEQEPVPDFSMVTQNGLQKFTGYYIQAYSDKNDIYTLSNGSNTIELPGETIKELNKPNLNEINFHGEVYSHILDHQYNDFFKYREPNIAAYFEHNLAVMIRTQAQNPLDTFKAAKEIIKAMPKDEQKRTKELVKKIAASQKKSVNDLMLDMYNKAMIERPMNEDFINVNNPRNIIPRHMTDLVYTPGHKIDDNLELRIGENINKVPVKAFKLNGKKQTIYLNLEVVSASKDKNLIVMKDSKENIYELPRDKILSQYEKNSIYNRRNQSVSVKHYNDSSMER